MSIRKALAPASTLQDHVCAGTKAIESKDVYCIESRSRRRVVESLYLDEALRRAYPNANRWDYIISTKNGLFGIETHSAKESEISGLIRKKNWAVSQMVAHLQPGKRVSVWYWVASGFVAFTDTGKTRRRLNQLGIVFGSKGIEFA